MDAHREGVRLPVSLFRYEPASDEPHWMFSYYGNGNRIRAEVEIIVPDKKDFTAQVHFPDTRETFATRGELEEIKEQEDDPSPTGLYFFRITVPAT